MTSEEHEPREATNPYRSPRADLSPGDERAAQGQAYVDFSQVPWHRRDRVNKAAALAGFFFMCVPLLWVVCLNVSAGDIYCKPLDYEMRMRRWGLGNRLIVWLLAIVQTTAFAILLVDAYSR